MAELTLLNAQEPYLQHVLLVAPGQLVQTALNLVLLMLHQDVAVEMLHQLDLVEPLEFVITQVLMDVTLEALLVLPEVAIHIIGIVLEWVEEQALQDVLELLLQHVFILVEVGEPVNQGTFNIGHVG